MSRSRCEESPKEYCFVRIAKSLAEVTEARRFALREPKRSSARHASREGDGLVEHLD
jgi:hypothetical protein